MTLFHRSSTTTSMGKTAKLLVELFWNTDEVKAFDESKRRYKEYLRSNNNIGIDDIKKTYETHKAKFEVKLTNLKQELREKIKQIEIEKLQIKSSFTLLPGDDDYDMFENCKKKMKIIFAVMKEFS